MMTDPQYVLPDDDDAIPVPSPTNTPQKGKGPDHSQLAARWLIRNRHTIYGLGEWRRYTNGYYPVVERDIIKREIKQVVDQAKNEGVRVSASLVESVTELARLERVVKTDLWDADTEYLPMKNGLLHIPTRCLFPHVPTMYFTSQLPFDYDPAADCPAFKKALERIPNEREFILEFAGYALTPDTSHELAVWLQGVPGSGKSTILEGFKAMLGSRSAKLGLTDIERSKFALTNLPGKTLIYSAEQPESFITASYIVNEIISGETITVERKYYDAIDIIPIAKIIWAMNDLPRVSSANDGIMRRVKVIKFPPLLERNKSIELKECIKTEGAGILNLALDGLERLHKRGRFQIPTTVEDATKDFQENNDIPKMFLDDIGARIDLTDQFCRTQSQYLYNEYRDWCIKNSHKPLTSTRMANEWTRLGFTKIAPGGVKYWLGVEITPFNKASNP
jgi:putative DNA primase/helicase